MVKGLEFSTGMPSSRTYAPSWYMKAAAKTQSPARDGLLGTAIDVEPASGAGGNDTPRYVGSLTLPSYR